jgi:hypothetical protein
MGAANAHTTASNIYQQKLDLISKGCTEEVSSCLCTKA